MAGAARTTWKERIHMDAILCLGMGYLIGCLSPAALLSWLKNVDLKKEGTGNLGATNTLLVLGKASGVLVMLLDIAKAFLSVKIARLLFPQLLVAGLLAGLGTMLGHDFPFFLKFQGGKGLAAFGGLVLAHDPVIFLILLTLGLAAMLVVNYGVALPLSAGILFPILAYLRSGSPEILLASALCSALLLVMHIGNVKKVRAGRDIPIRTYLREQLHKKEIQPESQSSPESEKNRNS